VNDQRKRAQRANRAKHRFRMLIANHLYRAVYLGREGTFGIKEWQAILDRYSPDDLCLACRQPKPLTIDHVIPLVVEGSTNWPENLQPLCAECNLKKRTEVIDYRPDGGLFARELTEVWKKDPGAWPKIVYLKPIWEKREAELGRNIRTSDMERRLIERLHNNGSTNVGMNDMRRFKVGTAEFPDRKIIRALCDLFFCKQEDIIFEAIGPTAEDILDDAQLPLFS